jgi:arylsulfatase A-like enzyme
VDWSVEVLMDELKRLGLDENTIMVFTSDNGSRNRDEGCSNAPLRGTKGTTWEGGMRLPCIVRWPGQVPAGQTCSELTASMDLLPTFANLAGTGEPDDRVIDGHDIAPLMLGEDGAESPWEEFYYYYRDRLDAVRRGRWKLRLEFDDEGKMVPGGEQLYDLEADIGETTDLSDELPDVVEEMKAALDRGREELGDEATGAEGRNIRPIGRVDDPKPLTEYDPDHPYIIAIYDLEDAG